MNNKTSFCSSLLYPKRMKKASKLKNTVQSAEDREFDEILSSANSSSPGSMSNEEFLPSNRLDDSPPLKKANMPMPANRAALIRQIEEEIKDQRRRKKLRDLGYISVLVLAILIGISLLSLTVWLFYVASQTDKGERFHTTTPSRELHLHRWNVFLTLNRKSHSHPHPHSHPHSLYSSSEYKSHNILKMPRKFPVKVKKMKKTPIGMSDKFGPIDSQ